MFYPSGGGIHIMNFDINKSQLPFVQERDVAIGKVYLIGSFTNSTDTYDLELTSNGGAVLNFSLSPGNSYQDVSSALPSGFGLGSFTFKIKKASGDIPDSEVKDIGLILDYQCS